MSEKPILKILRALQKLLLVLGISAALLFLPAGSLNLQNIKKHQQARSSWWLAAPCELVKSVKI